MKRPKKPDYWRLFCVLICAAVFCGAFFYSGDVAAQPAPTTQGDPNTHYTGDLFCPYNYDGIAGRVVHCIQSIIIQAAKTFLETFLPYYEAIVISALVLATTIYGAMTAMGALERPTGQTFIFIFKLAAVAYFTLEFADAIDWIFDIMEGLLLIVTNYVTVSQLGACSDTGHVLDTFRMQREAITVWDKVDCLFITLLGIGVVQTTAVGLTMLLSPLIFMGGIGLIIFILVMFFMLTLLVAVLRAIKIYLVSVITVAFLICVSPLIIPMLLFSQTKPIFDKWLKNLANYMMIPVFLFAYLSMIVAAYDAILFKGPSSLYYTLAHEASQGPDFNLRDWIEVGASGKVSRYQSGDRKGQVIYSGGEPVLESGTIVGKDVPGIDAVTIMQYQELCENGTEVEIELAGDICDADLETMLQCAINPTIPDGAHFGTFPEDGDCLDVEGNKYYGFQRNEEIFNFAIAPNITTDKEAREKRGEGCGRFDLLCKAGELVGKVVGAAFDLVKNVVGAIARVTGVILQFIGDVVKGIGTFVKGACRLTPVPGAVCDAAGGAFMISGSIIHAGGTFVNFSGRVLMNGLLEELGELFEGWFDVITLDFQKVASYRCKMEGGASGPTDRAYLTECPGPETIIIDIFYVMMTAAVIAYLSLRWLSIIPSLGREIIGGARVEATLPGEYSVQKGMGKLQHGLQRMVAKRKGMGKQ